MKSFRRHYPEGADWVVCQDVREAFSKRMGGITVEFLGLDSFRKKSFEGDYNLRKRRRQGFLTLPLSFEVKGGVHFRQLILFRL